MEFKKKKFGFTIVELMIAVTVFSAAMVLVLAGVIIIARQYQQASNRVKLEEASRNIHQLIGESIRFNGKDLSDTNNDQIVDEIDGTGSNSDLKAICIGNYMFIYGDAEPFTSLPVTQASGLWVKESSSCLVADISASGATNFLPANSVVSLFEVTISGSIRTNFLRVPTTDINMIGIYVDGAGNPIPGATYCDITISGREFCASVPMDSYAQRRVM